VGGQQCEVRRAATSITESSAAARPHTQPALPARRIEGSGLAQAKLRLSGAVHNLTRLLEAGQPTTSPRPAQPLANHGGGKGGGSAHGLRSGSSQTPPILVGGEPDEKEAERKLQATLAALANPEKDFEAGRLQSRAPLWDYYMDLTGNVGKTAKAVRRGVREGFRLDFVPLNQPGQDEAPQRKKKLKAAEAMLNQATWRFTATWRFLGIQHDGQTYFFKQMAFGRRRHVPSTPPSTSRSTGRSENGGCA
jgi:hypothetical protein